LNENQVDRLIEIVSNSSIHIEKEAIESKE
jgi:hypothetical protein